MGNRKFRILTFLFLLFTLPMVVYLTKRTQNYIKLAKEDNLVKKTQSDITKPEYVEGEVLVKLKGVS